MDLAAFRRRVGANVKRARWAAGLTQEEAAARRGVDFRHYQEIEAGRVDPKLSMLYSLAVGLGATVAALVDMDPVATRKARERMAVAKRPPTGRKPHARRMRSS